MNKLCSLLKRMEARGVKASTLLADVGIEASDLEDPAYKASASQFRAVLRNIVAVSPPGIGIAMGLEASIADEGVLGYAALSSATLRDVNNLIKTYLSLVENFTVYSDSIANGEWILDFNTAYPMGDVLPFLIEELFARSKVESRVFTGIDIPLKYMDLAYPKPAYADLYSEVFRCPVRFNQDRNRLVRDSRYLDLPIVFSNPGVCQLLEEQCAKLLGARKQSTKVGEGIRRWLIRHPGKYPLLADMSTAMGLSPTGLKRRLAGEGETYQGILDGIRQDLAVQYLKQTRLTAKEISYRLGFSNVHNFRRAFKAWTGYNPSHFQSSE